MSSVLSHVIEQFSRRGFGVQHQISEWKTGRHCLFNSVLAVRQPQKISDHWHDLVGLRNPRRHSTDVPADDRMTMNSRVIQQAAVLTAPPRRQSISNAEGHLDHRTGVVNRRELFVDRGSIERGEGDGSVQIIEEQKSDEQATPGRAEALRYPTLPTPNLQHHQHAEREIHTHHRSTWHARVLDQRHESREGLWQRQTRYRSLQSSGTVPSAQTANTIRTTFHRRASSVSSHFPRILRRMTSGTTPIHPTASMRLRPRG